MSNKKVKSQEDLEKSAKMSHINVYGEYLTFEERKAINEGTLSKKRAEVGDKDGSVYINKEGFLLKGSAVQYDDVAFNLAGKKLYSTTGKADFDWDRVCIKFQSGGLITNKADCVFGNEPYAHRFVDSQNSLDLVNGDLHFHWLQFNDVDQYELTVRWRVINNGDSYNDTDWNIDSIKTCNGHDLFPFELESGKDYMMQITKIKDISLKVGISAEFQIWTTRTDLNTTVNELYVTQIDFHMPSDSLGSIEPFQKYE